MNKSIQIAILVILAAAAIYLIPHKSPTPAPTMTTAPQSTAPDVVLDQPAENDLVTSPMTVKGRAVGSWYFEANLPVVLQDSAGNVLAQKGFHSIGDWMTTSYVEFNDTLTFTMPATQYGVLTISKDCGREDCGASFAVPVRFW